MLTERVVLEQEVSGPAAQAAAAVRTLTAALKDIGPDGVKAAKALAALTRAQTAAAGGPKALAAAAKASANQFQAAEREKAKAAQDAAKAIAKAEKDQERATKSAAKEAAKAAKEAAKAAKPPRKGLGPALPRTLEASGGSIGTIAAGVNFAGIQQKVAEIAAQALAFTVDMVKRGVVLAAEMAVFKDDTLDALEASLGSSAAAAEAFKAGQMLAREIGGAPTERLEQLRELLGKGFSQSQAIDTIKALADLKIRLPDLDAAGLQDALSKVANKGEFTSRALNQLNEVGFASEDIYAALAKRMNKTAAEVKALMDAGKVSGKEGIAAVLDLIKVKTGEANLGDIARAQADDLGVLFERLKNAPADIFLSMEGGGSGSLQKGLKSLVEQLDPTTASGQKLVRALERVRDAGDSLFADDSGAKGKLQQAAIEGLTNAIDGFAQGLEDTKPLVDGMFSAIAAITGTEDKASAMRGLGAAVAYAALAFAGLVAVVVHPFAIAANLIGTVIDQLRALAEPAHSSGQAIGQGLVRGLLFALTFGVSEIFYAGAQLAGAADKGARSSGGADVHSPSRKAMATARQIVAGYTVELGRGAGAVAVSGARLAAVSAGATANSNGGSAGSLGGGGVTITNYITIQGGGSAPGVEAAAAKGATEGTRAGLVGAQVRRWREAG